MKSKDDFFSNGELVIYRVGFVSPLEQLSWKMIWILVEFQRWRPLAAHGSFRLVGCREVGCDFRDFPL